MTELFHSCPCASPYLPDSKVGVGRGGGGGVSRGAAVEQSRANPASEISGDRARRVREEQEGEELKANKIFIYL